MTLIAMYCGISFVVLGIIAIGIIAIVLQVHSIKISLQANRLSTTKLL